MSRDIEEAVRNCKACLKFRNSQPHEKLSRSEVPHGPWVVLGTDLFYFQQKTYLLVVDYFDKKW